MQKTVSLLIALTIGTFAISVAESKDTRGSQAMQNTSQSEQLVTNIGRIASMALPEGFVKQPKDESPGNFGAQAGYSIKYQSPSYPGTTIGIFTDGLPTPEDSVQAFREQIKSGPKVVFSDANPITQSDETTVQGLSGVLGNARQNQVSLHSREEHYKTKEHGFHLQKLEVASISGEKVLSVDGWYYDPDKDERGANSYAIIIETSENGHAMTQNIYLESDTKEKFEKALPLFESALKTIMWRKQ